MTPERKIYLDDPNLGALEKRYLNEAIDTRFVSTVGPFVADFEAAFADFLHVKKAVSVQSGTAAIHIALYELGIGAQSLFCQEPRNPQEWVEKSQDEVIVPALTFAATAGPIMHVGARPVFVDVDPLTWTMDPHTLEQAITEHTKAIMPVHLYGNPCKMDAIMALAHKYNLYVIEDATESLGATYQRQLTGTFGEFGTFSFNGNKVITTGGGGMVIGADTERLEHIKFLANQARDASKGYYHPEVGFNYRMTNIEAALGLAQMQQVQDFLDKKREFYAMYHEELRNIRGLRFQEAYSGSESAWWLTSVVFENDRDVAGLQQELRQRGIPTRRIFWPIVEFPPYQQYMKGNFRHSTEIYKNGLCLPSSTLNSADDISYVCQTLRAML